jgi:hypothetical protein
MSCALFSGKKLFKVQFDGSLIVMSQALYIIPRNVEAFDEIPLFTLINFGRQAGIFHLPLKVMKTSNCLLQNEIVYMDSH